MIPLAEAKRVYADLTFDDSDLPDGWRWDDEVAGFDIVPEFDNHNELVAALGRAPTVREQRA